MKSVGGLPSAGNNLDTVVSWPEYCPAILVCYPHLAPVVHLWLEA